MIRDFTTVTDDMIYIALFDMDKAALRIQFGLPPPVDEDDDRERDFMSTLALQTILNIEKELRETIISKSEAVKRPLALEEMLPTFKSIVSDWTTEAKKIAKAQGKSFYRRPQS